MNNNEWPGLNSGRPSETHQERNWRLQLMDSNLSLREYRYGILEFLHDREQDQYQVMEHKVSKMLERVNEWEDARKEAGLESREFLEPFPDNPFEGIADELSGRSETDYNPSYWRFDILGPLRIVEEPERPLTLEEDANWEDDSDTVMTRFLNIQENDINRLILTMIEKENAICRSIAITRALIRNCREREMWLLRHYEECFEP